MAAARCRTGEEGERAGGRGRGGRRRKRTAWTRPQQGQVLEMAFRADLCSWRKEEEREVRGREPAKCEALTVC